MIICVCSFSDSGREWEKVLKFQMPDVMWLVKSQEEKAGDWIKEKFVKHLPILFISSVGIALRLISPLVKDKFTDSPVMVMDEGGRYIIPVLSGHIGGANELSRFIASKIGANPVITTATDVHGSFAVDVFARKNAFKIINRDCIKKVSEKILSKKEITMKISKEIDLGDEIIPESIILIDDSDAVKTCDVEIVSPENGRLFFRDLNRNTQTLYLVPKTYCLGIGCKKGKRFEELNAFLYKKLERETIENIAAISSIDLKKNAEGLMTLAQYYHVDYKTYSARQLEEVKSDAFEFSESDFVKEVTGVSNVCERAAILCAEETGKKGHAKLEVKKIAGEGITLALASKTPKIITWETL